MKSRRLPTQGRCLHWSACTLTLTCVLSWMTVGCRSAAPRQATSGRIHPRADSNALRNPSLEEVDRHAQEYMKKYPRSAFPELKTHPLSDPNASEEWAKESHQVAVDWAYNLKTIPDPNRNQPADKLVQKMINFILNGVAPVDDAPELPPGYWEKLQITSEKRITLAGYRIADLVLSAADQIEAQRKFIGR